MKIVFILQARYNSKRLKGKSLLPLYQNKCSIDIILEKISKIKEVSKIYLASGPIKTNIKIFQRYKNKSFNLLFKYEKNVRKRFEIIQKKEKSDYAIRATADNPLIEIELIRYLIDYLKKNKAVHYVQFDKKYLSPGLGVEIFKSEYFFKYLNENKSAYAKEHVTAHICKKNKSKFIKPPKKYLYPLTRLTIDYIEDYRLIKDIYTKIKKPNIYKINKFIK